jgi:hypothetical protein
MIKFKSDKRKHSIALSLCLILTANVLANSLRQDNPRGNVFAGMDLVRWHLISSGYDIENIGDIERALGDDSYVIRMQAATMLTYKLKAAAIPSLKKLVSDTELSVRCRVAHLLAMHGDDTGLDRMREDLAASEEAILEYERRDDAEKTTKPDEMRMRRKRQHLFAAFRSIHVLAKFGDCRGYEFAVNALRTTPDVAGGMMEIMVTMGKLDDSLLKRQNCDPIAVLCTIAESETDSKTLFILYADVLSLRYRDAIKVLGKLEASPHITEKLRDEVNGGIKWLKRRKEYEDAQKLRGNHEPRNKVAE